MDHCHCYLSSVCRGWDEEKDNHLVQTAIDSTDINECLLGTMHTTIHKVRGKVKYERTKKG